MTIREKYLYGLIQFETLVQSVGTWVDRTQDLVSLDYSEGGRVSMPGTVTVDVGTLNATFRSLSSVPTVGDFVRLRRYGTSEYAFTGYVQDVDQRVSFEAQVKLSTPVIVTTIRCVDWVAYATQTIVNGVGGRDLSFNLITTGEYAEGSRIRALNYALDSTNATQLVKASAETGGGGSATINDTDYTGTMADHLDLMARTANAYWYGSHVIPANNTTGRDNLIYWNADGANVSSNKTFTDAAGSAGQLHYTEIDFESSSQNVANTITLRNRNLVRFPDIDISRIGGANENNFIFIDLNTKVIGIAPDTEWRYDDTTSQAIYGSRFAELETNLSTPINFTTLSSVPYYFVNLIANPSVEYSDNGWSNTSANKVRRRQPSQDASPFAAAQGDWAIRVRQATTNTSTTINYSGGESDGIPVTVGRYYRFTVQAARGATSRTDLRAQIRINWYDADEAIISSATGSNVALTNQNTWYDVSHFAQAPANTNRATISVLFNRSGGGNITIGDLMWLDALHMYRTTSTNSFGLAYLDGDSGKGTSDITVWTGEVGNSQSLSLNNRLLNRASAIAAANNTTSVRATRIRWNAQEDLASVSSLTVGKTISLIYGGATTTYRIIGIDGSVDPDRYMIDYYLVKA